MRRPLGLISIAILIAALPSCMSFKVHQALPPTAWILVRAQGSLQQESDYEMARQAIPGALKTVEGFWFVAAGEGDDSDTADKLGVVLTEGYCQYGTAFVEDDWEVAQFKKDLVAVEYHNQRASNIFTRCLNYALMTLGSRWQKEIFGEADVIKKLLADTGAGKRTAMLFAGLALGSIINHNLTRIEMIGYLSTVQAIMDRVIELDKAHPPDRKDQAALPYIALGMLNTARPKALGGDPDAGQAAFETALKITDNKFLLARSLMALRVGRAKNDRKFFHAQLKQVLETPPSVWPEQRLANEVAHRKARRYLTNEKELF